MRESAFTKGRRLLVEGRIFVRRVDDAGFLANVRGDSGMYETGFDGARWFCTCDHKAASTPCSHVMALRLIFATGPT